MTHIPKRMREVSEGAPASGFFFAEKLKSSKNEFQPRYMTVANDILKRIFEGEYRPGTKLPSMRILAKKFNVSVQVILSALQGLQTLHYVESIAKRGVFVSRNIRPARYYRIGVFVLNQNPFSYSGLLYPLYRAMEEMGYTIVVGTNFDGGLTLKQWASHKHGLDGLIVIGKSTVQERERFSFINLPYIFLGTPVQKELRNDVVPEIKAFLSWFIGECIENPPEDRPVYLFENYAEDAKLSKDDSGEYEPSVIYAPERTDSGEIRVRKLQNS